MTTTEKQDDFAIQGMNSRILFLENQVRDLSQSLKEEREEKESLLEILEGQEREIEHLTRDLGRKKESGVTPYQARGKDYYSFVLRIQIGLKNAGFNPGLIDGKMGQATRAALRKFKKANGLSEDNRVDKQTWYLLCRYLN